MQRSFSRQCRLATYKHSTAIRQTTLADVSSGVLLPDNVRTWLDIELPEGRCVGVSFSDLPDPTLAASLGENKNHWMHSAYHPKELTYGLQLSDVAATSFWLGRLAMRIALEFPDYPILKDSFGRPQLDGRSCGSISHKGSCGVALISNNTMAATVGVDLEFTSRPGKRSIAPRVLTQSERESLGYIPGVSVEEEILLRFSLKEAIYKAVHPILCQYVGFQEAEVFPHPDGTASCTWNLESGPIDNCLQNLTAHWRRLDDQGFFLTSASVQRAVNNN